MHSGRDYRDGHDDLHIAGGASRQGAGGAQWEAEATFRIGRIGRKRSVGVSDAICNINCRDEHPIKVDETTIITNHPD